MTSEPDLQVAGLPKPTCKCRLATHQDIPPQDIHTEPKWRVYYKACFRNAIKNRHNMEITYYIYIYYIHLTLLRVICICVICAHGFPLPGCLRQVEFGPSALERNTSRRYVPFHHGTGDGGCFWVQPVVLWKTRSMLQPSTMKRWNFSDQIMF